jgi:hypothetical protein
MVDATPLKSEPAEVPKVLGLADLGKKIKSDHEALAASIRYIVDRAISIGEDLNKAKALVGHPKLTAMAIDSMDGASFATMLDRAIARSQAPPKMIEHRPNETKAPPQWSGPMSRANHRAEE